MLIAVACPTLSLKSFSCYREELAAKSNESRKMFL